MSRRAFAVALLIPLCVTAAAVAAAVWNRSGGREPIQLSEREVYIIPGNDADDTTATLGLIWHPRAVPDPRQLQPEWSLPQRAFVALELAGPAYRSLPLEGDREPRSRLVVVDVDPDAGTLARRYPNARTHLISPAVVRVPARGRYADAAVITLDPQRIHVPPAQAAQLPPSDRQYGGVEQPFEVEIRYGRNGEPWITAIRRQR